MGLKKITLDKNSRLYETLEHIKRIVNEMEEAEAYMFLFEYSKSIPGEYCEYSDNEKHGVPVHEDTFSSLLFRDNKLKIYVKPHTF